MNAPAPVLLGHDTAAGCVAKASANYGATIRGLEDTLRTERKAHVDYALDNSYAQVKRDAAANAGKVDAEKALTFIRAAHDSRERAIAETEARIADFEKAAALGDREATLALELMGNLRKYDAAGIDPASVAAQAASLVPALRAPELPEK